MATNAAGFTVSIDRERLRSISSAAARGFGRAGEGGPRVVSAEVLAETRAYNAQCRCEDLGLRDGMQVSALIQLGSGCTGVDSPFSHGSGWVCGRLDAIRRRYGK